MQVNISRLRLRLLLTAALAFVLAVGACSQFPDSVPCTTGKVYTRFDIIAMFPNKYVLMADESYAEVNPAFAAQWHKYANSVMDLLGMTPNWSSQFDCNRFALVKLAVIHVRYLVDTWHKRAPSQAVAAGECWYFPENGKPDPTTGLKPGHAIVVTIENGGPAFRDIYTDRQLFLTPQERASIFLLKF